MLATALLGSSSSPALVVQWHADGWDTQYCHLAAGSVAVPTGQRVDAGYVIARVGLRAGDVPTLQVLDPAGAVFAETPRALDRQANLRTGTWTVWYTITHDGETVPDRVAEWTNGGSAS